MNKMMQNTAAMQTEKDPGKMKSMMAQQSAMMQQSGMMQSMSGMMTQQNCPMMGAGSQTTVPSPSK
jgi:hypothetical protein